MSASGSITRPNAGAAKAFAAVRAFAGLTMISRVLGFGRDVVMATVLGTGLVADAFFLAWLLPNLARRLFGEGAFASALVPVFVEARGSDPAAARGLVGAAVARLGAGLVLLALTLEAALFALRAPAGHALLAGAGLDATGLARVDLALELGQLLAPYLVVVCLTGVLGSALTAVDRVSVTAAAPAWLNAVWIVALLGLSGLGLEPVDRVRLLAAALTLTGCVELWVHVRALAKEGLPVELSSPLDPDRWRRVRGLFLSLSLGMALFQTNVLCDGLIAFFLVPAGGTSALNYATRLVQLPVGILGVALSTALFPELARRAKASDQAGLWAIVDKGVALAAFVAVPAAVGLAALAGPLVATLFQRGAFDAASTARTARVVLLLAPAIVAACMTPLVTRAFHADEDVRTPTRIAAGGVLLNLLLNLLLVGPLQEAGLALASSISQTATLGLLALAARRRRAERSAPPLDRAVLGAGLRAGLLSLALGATALLAATIVPGPLGLGLAVLAGGGVYLGLARAVKAPELDLALARVHRQPSA